MFEDATKEENVLHKIVGIGALTILLAVTSAQAGPKFEIQPYAGMRTASSLGEGYYENNFAEKLSVAPGASFGLTLGIPVGSTGATGQQGMIELGFSYQKSDFRFQPAVMADIPQDVLDRFEVDGDQIILGNIDVGYIYVGGLYRFGDFSGWLPFVNGGLGATIVSAPDGEADSQSKLSFSLGTGVARMFSEKVGFRLGFKGYMTSLPADEGYWVDPWGGIWAVTDDNWLMQGELSLGLVFRP